MKNQQQESAMPTVIPAVKTNPVQVPESGNDLSMFVFASQRNFENAQRMANALASSTIVPAQFQKKKTAEAVANCIIALEMANRIGASPLMVMQNLYVVYGNVGWSSKFLIASLNTCGRFSPLRYEQENNGDMENWRCRAWAIDKTTGEPLHGAWVSLKMAKAEGWYDKSGSKWQTMPELMLQYRAAAFFQRTYAPEISMGMQTVEELNEIENATYEDWTPRRDPEAFDISKIKTLNDVNTALLRNHISKEEADGLREQITKEQARADVVSALERNAAAEAQTDEPDNQEPSDYAEAEPAQSSNLFPEQK